MDFIIGVAQISFVVFRPSQPDHNSLSCPQGLLIPPGCALRPLALFVTTDVDCLDDCAWPVHLPVISYKRIKVWKAFFSLPLQQSNCLNFIGSQSTALFLDLEMRACFTVVFLSMNLEILCLLLSMSSNYT